MAVCYVVGAGDCPLLPIKKETDDIIIAVDGGVNYLESSGFVPDIIIGDFDSLGSVPEGNNVIRLKPEKDVTDMFAAIETGVSHGFNEFEIFGATGGRLDHTLANIQLAASLAQKGIKHLIHGDGYRIVALENGEVAFDESNSGYISVFAHSDVCSGVSIEGLKYELKDASLTNNFTLGVSNEFTGKKSKISVKNGTLVIIYTKERE